MSRCSRGCPALARLVIPPIGNSNSLKHGRYTAEAIERRRALYALLRETRQSPAVGGARALGYRRSGVAFWVMRSDPQLALEEMRRRIYGGSRLLLDSLENEELAAVHTLLVAGEAEIICEACKPFVVRKLP